ncbi:hypothetical protein GMORB2_5787 [Geosmithia morbida]|uniref:Uncharacterized protein n=1 Tax=Geosmithia morbida TaxID=1094350 RepID=A0A9P4YVW7_9HYPO|nr:uncharacterized protein GMORB2_5787 [Geosmithia morbida]KAF4124071.1 hypothetical protein GMORB2_5787 [Geosmithia morbida]
MPSITQSHHDGRQHAASHHHGPVPGSPTLTNPDMILPDYDAPPSPNGRSQSSLMDWRDPNLDQLDFQLPPQAGYGYGAKSVAPATPIIYGNGTMLSDIGEVTEVESTVGPASRRASSRYSNYTETETFGPSSATVVMSKVLARRSKAQKARERRSSIDSTSTITTQDHRADFADFDDTVSVDDSSFQGDDEESMASEYVEGTAPARGYDERLGHGQEDGNNRHSTASISSRAELILATAKRRLTAMEGNLSRARSSLGTSEASTPSPQLVQSTPGVRPSTSASQITGHARIKSEDGPMGTPKQQPSHGITRSASALGAAGGYRQPLPKFKREDISSPAGYLSPGTSQFPLDTTLEALGEDEVHDTWSSADGMRNGGMLLTPVSTGFAEKGLTRSASAAQMRDIHDQMQGLRGKISSLKEQARADSLKRRSLQSLRTPSPFTHARWNQGLMEPGEIRAATSRETTPPLPAANESEADSRPSADGVGTIPLSPQEDDKTVSSDRRPMSSYSSSSRKTKTPTQRDLPDSTPKSPEQQLQSQVQQQPQKAAANHEGQDADQDEDDDLRTEDGDAYEDAYGPEEYDDQDDGVDDASDWASESGESLYHDTEQFATSHEDREDAFDYEHFFLHSAMGNMSLRAEMDESSESEFSDDSVETTRGPTTASTSMSHSRRYSGDSNASDETFATANDGRPSRMSMKDSRRGSPMGTPYEELSPLREVRSEDASSDRRLSEDEDDGDEHVPGIPAPRNQHHYYSAAIMSRPTSASATQAGRLHRPSVSSFESAGTTRSFPLVNKSKITSLDGVLTPGGSPSSSGSSPDPAKQAASTTATADHLATATPNGVGNKVNGISGGLPMQNLPREDQIAVERLVASLGRCVLDMSEGGPSRAGSEYRMLRRRLNAARLILEGQRDAASP